MEIKRIMGHDAKIINLNISKHEKEFMKTLLFIPLLSFVLLTVGCIEGDFMGTNAIIVNKSQSAEDKEKKQAEYKIKFCDGRYANLTIILPENFGEAGDIVTGEIKGKLVAKPKPVKVEDE